MAVCILERNASNNHIQLPEYWHSISSQRWVLNTNVFISSLNNSPQEKQCNYPHNVKHYKKGQVSSPRWRNWFPGILKHWISSPTLGPTAQRYLFCAHFCEPLLICNYGIILTRGKEWQSGVDRVIWCLDWALSEYVTAQPWLGLTALLNIWGKRILWLYWSLQTLWLELIFLFHPAPYNQCPLPTQPPALPVFVQRGGASASLEQGNDLIKMVLDMKSKIQSPILPLPPIAGPNSPVSSLTLPSVWDALLL